jgi:recombination protein RecA
MPLDMDKPVKKTRTPPRKAKVKGRPNKSLEMMSLEEKLEAPSIVKAREAIKAKFGDHVIAGYDKPMPKIEVIPTGFRNLDLHVIGGGNPRKGGLVRGFPVEFAGKESGGKSTLALACVANAQRHNEHCVWIDLERTMDDEYAEAIGVDTSKWDYCVPADGDEAAEMILLWSHAGASIIVLDSIGVLDTKADIDKPLDEEFRMASAVHLIKKILVKTAKPLYDNKTVLLMINQVRVKMGAKSFQKQTQTTGGHRLKHAFCLRLEISKGQRIKEGDRIVGIEMIVKCEKNKVGPPMGTCTLPVMFGEGISKFAVTFEEAVQCGVIEKKGAYYKFSGEVIGQGKANAREYLEENPEVMALIERELAGEDEPEEDLTEDAEPEEYNLNLEDEISLEG